MLNLSWSQLALHCCCRLMLPLVPLFVSISGDPLSSMVPDHHSSRAYLTPDVPSLCRRIGGYIISGS